MKAANLAGAVLGAILIVVFVVIVVYMVYTGVSKCYDYGYRIFTEPAVSSGEGRKVTVTLTSDMSATEIGTVPYSLFQIVLYYILSCIPPDFIFTVTFLYYNVPGKLTIPKYLPEILRRYGMPVLRKLGGIPSVSVWLPVEGKELHRNPDFPELIFSPSCDTVLPDVSVV